MIAQIFILGFVQGVGFRRFVKAKARKLGLTGWVKNLPDGRVEACVCGEKEKIEQLIRIIEKGSFFSDVKSVQANFEDINSEFISFDILHE
jgi:acylphosphatase